MRITVSKRKMKKAMLVEPKHMASLKDGFGYRFLYFNQTEKNQYLKVKE